MGIFKEWPLYVFDAAPMLVVMAIWWWWFPSTILGKRTWVSMISVGGSLPLSDSQRSYKG
jgi:hypothetical protein